MEAAVLNSVSVNQVSNFDATEGLRVNRNREYWDALYLQIRKLCVVKGERIRKYSPEYAGNPRKSIQFKKGEVKINEEFWSSLKPAHKSQLKMIVNKIQALYKELEYAQVR